MNNKDTEQPALGILGLKGNHFRKLVLICGAGIMLSGVTAFSQAKPGQVIANIPSEAGTIVVANAENKLVSLTFGDLSLPLEGEEALALANWIKEGKSASYPGKAPFTVRRESNGFVILVPQGEKSMPWKMKPEWAVQFAQALASGRMNTSESGKP
jgi:hypothetical protein